jgi:hypothetical protein
MRVLFRAVSAQNLNVTTPRNRDLVITSLVAT